MSATKRKANGQKVSVSSAEALSVKTERPNETEGMDTADKVEPIAGPAAIVDIAVTSGSRAGRVDRVNWDERAIYSLPKRTSEDIVDLVLKIMDAEGPRPMRNMRPAQKIRTGADQFYVNHHAQYEARGQQSRNTIGRVHTHNNAYPKMYDELHKRQSTAQVEPGPAGYAANQNMDLTTNYERNCRGGVKSKKQTELDGRRKRTHAHTRPSYHRDHRTKSNLRDIRTKITKPKRPRRRSPSRMYKLSKIKLNKGCQCTCYHVASETKSVSTFNDNFLSVPVPTTQQEVNMVAVNVTSNENNCKINHFLNTPMQASKKFNKKASKSEDDSRNPGTVSAPSVSSYNSYMSMDHEPMVE